MLKKVELLGATALALLIANPAAAQQKAPANNATAAEDESEIVVTATKREQTLQDVPLAVSVASAEKFEQAGVRDLVSIAGMMPTLRVGQFASSSNTNFVIRGFGNGAFNPGIEPSVGVFVDGVYRSRAGASINDIPDLKRVEVLRGPQSTLFGKNASVGVISIVTQEPKFKFGGSAEASYGNYNAIVGKANITGPISQTVAYSLSGGFNKRDGYSRVVNLNQNFNNRNRWFARGQLLFEPSDTTKFRMIADYDDLNENCCQVANVVDGPTGNIVRALGGQINSNQPFSHDTYMNFLTTNQLTNYGISLQGDMNFGNLKFTTITAYRKGKARQNQDSDFTSADLLGRNSEDRNTDTFTQEFRLTSDFTGPLNFLLGGFYMNEKVSQYNEIFYGTAFRGYAGQLISSASGGVVTVPTLEAQSGAVAGSFFALGQGLKENYTLKDNAYSIFGTVDYKLTDRLTLTGGLAYNNDRKASSINILSTDVWSGTDLDGAALAPYRNALLKNGAIAQQVGAAMGLGRSATAAEVGAFTGNIANIATTTAIVTGATAYANANQFNAAANPLASLKPLQFLPPFLNAPNAVESGKTGDGSFSYSLRLAYKATDTINLYASYATGFKASSINLTRDSRPFAADFIPGSSSNIPAPAASPIRSAGLAVTNLSTGTRFAGPEEARVIEFGIKGKWQHVAANLTFFDQSVTGFQDNTFVGTGFVLANAGKQSTKGIEFDSTVSPSPSFSFDVAFSYLDAKYDSFVGCQINGASGNCTGLAVPNVSELSASFGATYKHRMANDDVLMLHANFNYDAPVNISLNVPGYQRELNGMDANLTYKMHNGIEFSLWGRNLLQDKYLITVFRGVAQQGTISGYPNEPRTYGATVRYKF